MTPASTSQRAVDVAVEHTADTSQQCTVATSSIVQGTKKPPLHYRTFGKNYGAAGIAVHQNASSSVFRSVHATRYWILACFLFSEFLRPNSDEHLPRWPKVVKQVVKVSPVCTGQTETFNQVAESRPTQKSVGSAAVNVRLPTVIRPP